MEIRIFPLISVMMEKVFIYTLTEHWTMAHILYFMKLLNMLLVACFLFLSTTINILSGKSGHSFSRYIGKTYLLHIWLCILFLVATRIYLFISLVHILFPICNENHFSSISWISNLVQTQRWRGKRSVRECQVVEYDCNQSPRKRRGKKIGRNYLKKW